MVGPLTGGRYVIVVDARLGHDWGEWFDGFATETVGDVTRISGEVVDQAALHGLLTRLRDLAIPILEVRRIPETREDPALDDHRGRRNTPAGT